MRKEQLVGHAIDAASQMPPWTVVLSWLMGVPIEKWLVVATLGYTLTVWAHRVFHFREPPKGK